MKFDKYGEHINNNNKLFLFTNVDRICWCKGIVVCVVMVLRAWKSIVCVYTYIYAHTHTLTW